MTPRRAPQLRDYQLRAISDARELVALGQAPTLVVAPTGAGKTVIAGEIMAGAARLGHASILLARRIELVDQTSGKLDDIGLDHGIIQADHWRRRPHLPVQVASVQTLSRREGSLKHLNPAIVIADEAHESLSPTYLSILTQLRDRGATVIGLTATPYLLDGTGLGAFYKGLVITAQIHELIAQGYLVPIDVLAPTKPSLAGVKVVRGEFRASDIELIMGKRVVVGDIVRTWQSEARGRTTAVFADSKANARQLCDAFLEAGIPSKYLDDETPGKERAAIKERIATGVSLVVVNIGILTLGWDMPRVSCVVLARPTLSRSLYRQMIGRGTRPYPGKTNLLVLDHAGNIYRHGYPDAPEEFSLAGTKRVAKTTSVISDRCCLQCYRFSPPHMKICKHCGEPFPIAEDSGLVFVDGKLEPMRRPDGSIVEPPKLTEDQLKAANAGIPLEKRIQMVAKWTCEAALRGWKKGYAWTRYVEMFREEPDQELMRAAGAMTFPRFLIPGGKCRHCNSIDIDAVRTMPLEGGQIVCRSCGRGLSWCPPEYAALLAEDDSHEAHAQVANAAAGPLFA